MPDNSTKFNPNLQLDIPKWISKDYFKKILQKELPNFSKILKFSSIAATPPGENYTSLLVRIAMDIKMKGLLKKENINMCIVHLNLKVHYKRQARQNMGSFLGPDF